MPIYQTASYRVTTAGLASVGAAVEEFVEYVRANEPGTRMYAAWQEQADPTRFVHEVRAIRHCARARASR